MKNFIKMPDVTVYKGMIVNKNTTLKYKREDGKLKQELKNLDFVQWEKRETDDFESETKTTIHMKEGMCILFEDEKRGYVVPVDKYVTIGEARQELEYIKDLDKEV